MKEVKKWSNKEQKSHIWVRKREKNETERERERERRGEGEREGCRRKKREIGEA